MSDLINDSLQRFGVSLLDIEKAIKTALEKGGKYADLFFEHSLSSNFVLLDGTVSRASSEIDFGVGVRVVDGNKNGYAFVENINLEDILQAAKTAARIADNALIVNPKALKILPLRKNLYPFIKSPIEISPSEKVEILNTLNKKVFDADSRVVKLQGRIAVEERHILFANSEGCLFADTIPDLVIALSCVMEQNGKRESNSVSFSKRVGAEYITEQILDDLVDELISKTSILFESIKPKGGQMPVVMGAGSSGILLHEAIGHSFEADFNRKNISIFADKLGKKICSEQINIVDDATISHNRGAVNFDDEGVEGQKTYIVKNGILNSYLHDRISADFYKVAPTGNGRRASFREIPYPRMRTTYMEAGNFSEEEIISSVKSGVYVSNFTNGQVKIGAGDFTFYVKNGFLIENGKLTQPIKDINVIGNGPKALADISMVANNFKIDNGTWMCGKQGQNVPVSLGMPSALVKNLIVGGEN